MSPKIIKLRMRLIVLELICITRGLFDFVIHGLFALGIWYLSLEKLCSALNCVWG